MGPAASRRIWEKDGLTVRVRLTARGDLEFAGHDLSENPFGDEYEYEYWVTVRAADVPAVVSALDGRTGDDVLELVARHSAAIGRLGERTWLEANGIAPRFFCR